MIRIRGDGIQSSKFKRGYKAEISRIKEIMKETFSIDPTEDADRLTISYGALSRLEAWIDEKKLFVDTDSNADVEDSVILDTNKRFRDFLLEATGYTAKQRRDQAKKESSK